MTTLALNGGSTPDVTTSFTDKWVETASGVSLPTDTRLAANGKRPVYVASVRVYWAGRLASRKLRVLVGGVSTSTVTVGSAGSAGLSSPLPLGVVFNNGGVKTVRIDANPDGSFYFGRESGTGSVDSYGTSFGQLSGSVEYYEVPSAPTSVDVNQDGTKNAVNISWDAPSSNGGSSITSYVIEWSYNSNFSGSSKIATGSTARTFKLTGLTYGSRVYVRVAAENIVSKSAGTTSVFSSSANAYLTAPNLSLNGWANFGSHGGSTFTIKRTVIPALVPETGILREAVSTTASGSYGIGTKGIEKTYTGLTIGREYILSGKAILLTAAMPGNIYRFSVNTIGNGSSVTLTSTTVGATIPSYTFTATATSHTVRIELAETVSVIVGKMEHVAFYDFALTRLATELTYRLQDNLVTASLTDHFDLATQSVGAYWWVDKNNETNFLQNYDYILPTATFSDEIVEGNIYYSDIQTSYDTSDVINEVTFKNYGVKDNWFGETQVQGYEVEWVDRDSTSVNTFGPRSLNLDTNLRTTALVQNLFIHPAFDNYDYEATAATFRTSVERPLSNSTPFDAYSGTNALRAYQTATGTIVTVTNQERITVEPGVTYYGIVYAATHATPNIRSRIRLDWYDETNTAIATTFGTYVTISNLRTWYKTEVSADAPAGAISARIAGYFTLTTGGNIGVGAKQWIDGIYFGNESTVNSFDGNTRDTNNHIYSWDGSNNQSTSTKYNNILDTRSNELLSKFSTPIVRVTSLTWNTAQNPVSAANLDVGSLINVEFNGTSDVYRVTGINHDITPERWMMTLQTAKVT
jgi:hypothetical protein